MSTGGLHVLVVDDEALARARMRTLLGDCRHPPVSQVTEAGNAAEAQAALAKAAFDVVLLDIHMPGMDGLTLADGIRRMDQPPAIVFVTAHAEHALQAFDLAAVDYLTKPVRLERLQQALQKSERYVTPNKAEPVDSAQATVLIHDRGRTERVPLAQVLYFKAELKYLTVRTADKSYLAEGALNELEALYPSQYLRIHRNALVAKHAIRALEKQQGPSADDELEFWTLQLHGVDDTLQVSRRQLPAVRAVLAGRD